MTKITRTEERLMVEVDREESGDVAVRINTLGTFRYTPHEAVQIAHALLDAAGVKPQGEPSKAALAEEAWDAAAEENEHARQRNERTVTHGFDVDQAMRYVWVVPKEGAAPDEPAWLGLWDQRDDVVAEFRNGLTDEGRRRTMESLGFLIWKRRTLCPVFEIEVR